jgi:hypothetical protein
MSKAKADRQETPLSCRIIRGQLVIRVGLNRLNGNECHHEICELDIVDPEQWGRDVVSELTREEEDGSSPLGNLLDTAILEAVEMGSIGVGTDSCERIRKHIEIEMARG